MTPPAGCPAGLTTSSAARGHRARTALPSPSPTRSATSPTRRWPPGAPPTSTARRGPRTARSPTGPGPAWRPPAGPDPEQDRGRHRSPRRAHRRAGDVRHQPAGRPGPRSGRPGRRELRFFADVIVTLHEDAFRSGTSQLGYVLRKPSGPAGLITPWNTPFMLETWKLAPALAAGGGR